MALIDSQNLLSDKQAITATAASTNVIDLGATVRNIAVGEPVPLTIVVNEAFNNLTSLAIAIQTDDNSSFSSATTVYTTTVLAASLVVGYKIPIKYVPDVKERYVRAYYTVTGTAPSTGKITAGLFESGDWVAYDGVAG